MTDPDNTSDTATTPADDDGWAWAESMQNRYGTAPDDLPDRQPGQPEAEYRAAVEQMMAERAQATAEPPSGPADAPAATTAGDGPEPPVEGVKTEAPVDQSIDDANDGDATDDNARDTDDETAGDTPDVSDDATQDDDRPTSEAAKYRIRLREAEAKLAAAEELIATTRQAIVDHELARVSLDPKLLAAAGHTTDTLLDDDGQLIDHGKLTAAIEATIAQFHVDIPGRPRRPMPVGAVGRGSGAPPRRSGLEAFTSAFSARG